MNIFQKEAVFCGNPPNEVSAYIDANTPKYSCTMSFRELTEDRCQFSQLEREYYMAKLQKYSKDGLSSDEEDE